MNDVSSGGFQVAADQLEGAANAFEDAAADWEGLVIVMPEWILADDALGFLGQQAGVVQDYNAALAVVLGKTVTGTASLKQAADELRTSARTYDSTESPIKDGFSRMESPLPEGPGRT